jgi:hypothetical protein
MVSTSVIGRVISHRPQPAASALGQLGEYNGFTGVERARTAALSNWLASVGCLDRPQRCDICRKLGKVDEHAEDYYDLGSWIGLCHGCHRSRLHKRFTQWGAWQALLDLHEVPAEHWTRLVSQQPFDLAILLRQRGRSEPTKAMLAMR